LQDEDETEDFAPRKADDDDGDDNVSDDDDDEEGGADGQLCVGVGGRVKPKVFLEVKLKVGG
jgi:hypothetical protein